MNVGWLTKLLGGRYFGFSIPIFRTAETGYVKKTMELNITRNKKTIDGIFGDLKVNSSAFQCFTCENLKDAIHPGTYKVTFDLSRRFNRIMPHVWVPDRDEAAVKAGFSDAGIRIHWGNYPSNYEGCIGVGNGEEPDSIDETLPTFNQLFNLIKDEKELTLTLIENYPQVPETPDASKEAA